MRKGRNVHILPNVCWKMMEYAEFVVDHVDLISSILKH
jgi:hypothetical protein